jgi:hypothetical protein
MQRVSMAIDGDGWIDAASFRAHSPMHFSDNKQHARPLVEPIRVR